MPPVRNILATVLALLALASACTHTQTPPDPQLGNAAGVNPRARDAGRAAGAGGSHAPGGSGLGAGTMGVPSTATGSTR